MSLKSKTNEVLLDTYKRQGYTFTVDLAFKILLSEESKKMSDVQDRNTVSGEVCESVLEICILELKRRMPEKTRDWFYAKGLILKDKENPKSEFLTEIDFVLFTPQKIFLFECKSYRGDKIIVEEGTIQRKGQKSFDVFNQHSNHAKVFAKTFESFKPAHVHDFSSYQLAVFSFAPGKLTDKREAAWKEVLPFMNARQTMEFFADGVKGDKVWNLSYAKQAVEIIEKHKEAYVAKHLKYVKSLRRNSKQS